MKIGKVNELTVVDEDNSGFYLKSDQSDEEAFMPPNLGPGKVSINEKLKVFVYLDKTDSLLATTQIPHTLLGEFGLMKVVNAQSFGAFLDWGTSKDLFVPDNEQLDEIHEGEFHIVRVCLDENTDKLYGTTKINKYIQASKPDFKEGDRVSIIPASKEKLGYRSIINKKYIGMIYYNEIFTDVKINQPLEGVVKKIRPDGLIDAALQTQGFQNLINSQDKILLYLEEIGGKSPLHDKSPAGDIQKALGMSKQTFKKSIGMLFREGKIEITKEGIKLS